MNLTILFQEPSKTLSRKAVVADLTFSKVVPPRPKVRQALATHLKVQPELVVIERIRPVYGAEKATVTAYVYDDAKSLSELTPAHLLTRGPKKKGAEEAPAAEQKPAEVKDEQEAKEDDA
ncbi:hypothetical protein JXB02_00555 [Candidatus Woesearchaeota archaeon]|nr:hypothetical protein [Candidatus Woesearchaeota archaeon]